tara:strand:+ start:188 stop:322 length:135 start_codon:yes stop_codon:yes gene_type:complete
MDERLRFVARRLEGESMTDLCREKSGSSPWNVGGNLASTRIFMR